jgi:hypothetical protein
MPAPGGRRMAEDLHESRSNHHTTPHIKTGALQHARFRSPVRHSAPDTGCKIIPRHLSSRSRDKSCSEPASCHAPVENKRDSAPATASVPARARFCRTLSTRWLAFTAIPLQRPSNASGTASVANPTPNASNDSTSSLMQLLARAEVASRSKMRPAQTRSTRRRTPYCARAPSAAECYQRCAENGVPST